MNVTTPKTQQTGFEKRLHTPPTIEREKGKTTPTKFLKGLSSSIFKRGPDLKKQQISRFDDNASDLNFSTIPKMSRRMKTPKPLNLTQPLSPPKSVKKYEGLTRSTSTLGSFQSVDNMSLASPVTLQGNIYEKPKNLARLLHDALDSPTLDRRDDLHLSLDQSKNSLHHNGNLEDISSPCSRNTSLMSSRNAKCFKKYIGERCCICDEAIHNSFTGEKIIELSCSHITHYNCYLTLYECTFQDNEYPMCGICNTQVSPQDPELTNTLAYTVLTQEKKVPPRSSARPLPRNTKKHDTFNLPKSQSQYMELKSAKITDPSFMSFTPIEQIIKTADISCNGFKELQSESECRTLNEIELSICDSLESETFSLFHPEPTSASLESPILDKSSSPTVTWKKNSMNKNLSLKVNFPGEQSSKMNLQSSLRDEVNQERINETYNKLTHYIQERFFFNTKTYDDDINFDRLKLFDLVSYSTDNQNWSHNISIFHIDDLIILYDHNSNKIIGKIPQMEISQVTTIDNNSVLIIDTKSITSPEIFLRFNDDSTVVNKWKYYLQNPKYVNTNPLSHITDTAMFILSDDLIDNVQEYNNDKDNHNTPWTQEEELPLRLILCIDLCPHTMDVKAYKLKLTETIRSIMSMLKDNDLFGLVTVGNVDERRNVLGQSGTYIGMIDKLWGEWDDIIRNLEVNSHSITSKDDEIQSMLATCFRLVSTLPDNEIDKYQNKILYLNQFDNEELDINQLVINRKFHDKIFNKQRFQMCQYSLVGENEDIIKLMGDITCLKYFDVKIAIGDKTMFLGHINDSKKITVYDPMLNVSSHHECKISWEDKDTKEIVYKIVPLLRE